ncbi:hypothetical protein PYCC9005_001708 [Savitreella phatthalungensis]
MTTNPGQSQPRFSHQAGKLRDDFRPTLGARLLLWLIHTFYWVKLVYRRAIGRAVDLIARLTMPQGTSRDLIKRDISSFAKIPSHVAIILQTSPSPATGKATLPDIERMVDEVADLAAWSLCCSIPILTVYESSGELKGLDTSLLVAIKRKVRRYFRDTKRIRIATPGWDHVSGNFDEHRQLPDLEINLLSKEDGKEALLELTRSLCAIAASGRELKERADQSRRASTAAGGAVGFPAATPTKLDTSAATINRHQHVSGSVKEQPRMSPRSPVTSPLLSGNGFEGNDVARRGSAVTSRELRRSIQLRRAQSPTLEQTGDRSHDLRQRRAGTIKQNGNLDPSPRSSPLINGHSADDDDDHASDEDDDEKAFSHEIRTESVNGLGLVPTNGNTIAGDSTSGKSSSRRASRLSTTSIGTESSVVLTSADITVAFVDEHLSHMTIGEPDLLIVFKRDAPSSSLRGPAAAAAEVAGGFHLDDFPPWAARLCEITWRGGPGTSSSIFTNASAANPTPPTPPGNVTYRGFLAGLRKYGTAEMRWGK